MKSINKIIDFFGEEYQVFSKTPEELQELQEAINSGNVDHIFEEMCDCLVMFIQLKKIFNWDDKKINMQCKKKVYRTLKRIDSGYYKNEKLKELQCKK